MIFFTYVCMPFFQNHFFEMKKAISLSFLFLATFLFLGHSMIPHHHHKENGVYVLFWGICHDEEEKETIFHKNDPCCAHNAGEQTPHNSDTPCSEDDCPIEHVFDIKLDAFRFVPCPTEQDESNFQNPFQHLYDLYDGCVSCAVFRSSEKRFYPEKTFLYPFYTSSALGLRAPPCLDKIKNLFEELPVFFYGGILFPNILYLYYFIDYYYFIHYRI